MQTKTVHICAELDPALLVWPDQCWWEGKDQSSWPAGTSCSPVHCWQLASSRASCCWSQLFQPGSSASFQSTSLSIYLAMCQSCCTINFQFWQILQNDAVLRKSTWW